MAITHGHGNPNWTRDETILALDLYFECNGHMPSNSDERVQALSTLLRAFPHHSHAERKNSFRNADGVVFKLQNLRQVATGKGLGNVSKIDREVWEDLGGNPAKTKELANLIRAGVEIVEGIKEETTECEVFAEGKVVTETHLRRERDPKLRNKLLEQRKKFGALECDICGCTSLSQSSDLGEAIFEAHHIIPLSASQLCQTKLTDMTLLCANCHRMIHRAIALEKRWLSIEETKVVIFGEKSCLNQ